MRLSVAGHNRGATATVAGLCGWLLSDSYKADASPEYAGLGACHELDAHAEDVGSSMNQRVAHAFALVSVTFVTVI
jgi:hypothetical protein